MEPKNKPGSSRLVLYLIQCVHSERSAGEWEQAHKACPLDCSCNHALLACIGAQALAPVDLAVGCHHATKGLVILVVTELDALARFFGCLWCRAAGETIFAAAATVSVAAAAAAS